MTTFSVYDPVASDMKNATFPNKIKLCTFSEKPKATVLSPCAPEFTPSNALKQQMKAMMQPIASQEQTGGCLVGKMKYSNGGVVIDPDEDWLKTIGDCDQAWRTTVNGDEISCQNETDMVTKLDNSFEQNNVKDNSKPHLFNTLDHARKQPRDQRLNTAIIEDKFLAHLINEDHIDLPDEYEETFLEKEFHGNQAKTLDANWVFSLLWDCINDQFFQEKSKTISTNSKSNISNQVSDHGINVREEINASNFTEAKFPKSLETLIAPNKAHSSPIGLVSNQKFNTYLNNKNGFAKAKGATKCTLKKHVPFTDGSYDSNYRNDNACNANDVADKEKSSEQPSKFKDLEPDTRRNQISVMPRSKNHCNNKHVNEAKFHKSVFRETGNIEGSNCLKENISSAKHLGIASFKPKSTLNYGHNYRPHRGSRSKDMIAFESTASTKYKTNSYRRNSRNRRSNGYSSSIYGFEPINGYAKTAPHTNTYDNSMRRKSNPNQYTRRNEVQGGIITIRQIMTDHGVENQTIKRAFIASDSSS